MRRGLTATGALHAQAVWERYAVLSEWPSWSPQIRYVECAEDRLAPGLTGRVHGWFGVSADFEVLSVDEVRRTWSLRARSGPVTLTPSSRRVAGRGGQPGDSRDQRSGLRGAPLCAAG